MDGLLDSRSPSRWDLISADNFLLLDVWVYLQLIPNTILLPLVVGTFLFSSRVQRHPTVINVCVTWILSGVFSLLLFYSNQHKVPAREVNESLCLAQASLLYGITPMWAVGAFMMVFHLRNCMKNPSNSQVSKPILFLMLSAPYLVQCAFSTAASILALHHPELVSRNSSQFYCGMSHRSLSLARMIFTSIVCLLVSVVEVHIAIILLRRLRSFRKAGFSSGVSVGLLARVLIFGVFIFAGSFINIIPLVDKTSAIPDMYAAFMGLVIFLVFGTQLDIVKAWCFWRRSDSASSSSQNRAINVSLANSFDENDNAEWKQVSKKTLTPSLENGRRP